MLSDTILAWAIVAMIITIFVIAGLAIGYSEMAKEIVL